MKLKREDGFTLVEMAITVVVVGIIMLVITGMYTAVSRSSKEAEGRLDNAQTIQMITTYFADDVQGAWTSNQDSVTGDVTFEGDTFSAPHSDSIGDWTVVYHLEGTELQRTHNGGDPLTIARNVCGVAYTPGDTATLTITSCTPGSAPITITGTKRI